MLPSKDTWTSTKACEGVHVRWGITYSDTSIFTCINIILTVLVLLIHHTMYIMEVILNYYSYLIQITEVLYYSGRYVGRLFQEQNITGSTRESTLGRSHISVRHAAKPSADQAICMLI